MKQTLFTHPTTEDEQTVKVKIFSVHYNHILISQQTENIKNVSTIIFQQVTAGKFRQGPGVGPNRAAILSEDTLELDYSDRR